VACVPFALPPVSQYRFARADCPSLSLSPVPERSKGDTRGKLFLRKILDDVKRKASAISV